MPSGSLQSRIQAFESLGTPINLNRKVISTPDDPHHGSSMRRTTSPPLAESLSSSNHSSEIHASSSLIDLTDWVVHTDTGLLTPMIATKSASSAHNPSSDPAATPELPVITLDSSPAPTPMKRNPPPLPPRKPSYISLKSVNSKSTPSSPSKQTPTMYPLGGALSPNSPNTAGSKDFQRHAQASSISSFHSVSLSDGGETPSAATQTFAESRDSREIDGDSLDESFENLSATSSAPPFEWPRPGGVLRKPPPPPPQSDSGSSVLTTSLPYVPRKAPPVPARATAAFSGGPPSSRTSVASASDRSSILSATTSTTSRTSASAFSISGKPAVSPALAVSSRLAMRPTPIPVAARSRYEAVFSNNIRARKMANAEAARESSRQKGRKTGWRGISVDLLMQGVEDAPSTAGNDGQPVTEETLNGHTVVAIWSASQLDRAKLRSIWIECDPGLIGRVNCEGFVKGMWRIDEELRRAQAARRVGALPTPHQR